MLRNLAHIMASGKQQFVKFQISVSSFSLKSNCLLLASQTKIHGIADLRPQIIFLRSKAAMGSIRALLLLPDSQTL